MSTKWSGSATVYGAPQAMGSKRGFFIKKLNRVVITDEKGAKLKTFQEGLRDAMRDVKPSDPLLTPIAVSLEVVMGRPKGHYGSGRNSGLLKHSAPELCITKPDMDKVLRTCLDCGTGIWFRDDSQVCEVGRLIKRYAKCGEEEHTRIEAEELDFWATERQCDTALF